jgi:hypothetical protein
LICFSIYRTSVMSGQEETMNKLWFTAMGFCVIMISLLISGCSNDKPTQPPANQSSLLLSKLVVSVVPGGNESITVSSFDGDGAFSECGVSNSDPSVASCVITDSTLQIAGIAIGTSNLTITNQAGKSCVLPVEVYDKNILDAGEFLIAYTDNYYDTYHFGFFIPIPPEGFYALGGLLTLETSFPNGRITMMTVKPKPGTDAIAFTDSFVTTDQAFRGRIWKPIPPAGYKAMGYVVTMPGVHPASQACIREDLTTVGSIDEAIYIDSSLNWYSAWKIDAPFCGAHRRAYLAPGTFTFCDYSIDPPANDPLMNVLNVDLPTLAEAPEQIFAPRLTSLAPPPMETAPTLGKALLAPFSVITDLYNDIAWQMDNSPTYRVDRQVFYKCLYHNYNQTDVLQTNSYEVVSGISSMQSETFRATAGIAISAELGVSFSPAVSAKIAATVSYEVGYERLTGITEFQETHRTTSLNIPPGKAGAIWQRFNRFTLYRHDGNSLEVVGVQDIGLDSYVTDVYPD